MYLKKHDFFSNMDYIDINTEISEAKIKKLLAILHKFYSKSQNL